MDNRDKFISANTVLVGTRTFKECYKENEKVFSPELVEFAFNVLNMVEEFVNRAPPDDVAKVVRGKWIYDHWCEFKCSVCGEYSNSKPYKGKENYCPNCGAKMNGGEFDE